jgi:hypothetical protein
MTKSPRSTPIFSRSRSDTEQGAGRVSGLPRAARLGAAEDRGSDLAKARPAWRDDPPQNIRSALQAVDPSRVLRLTPDKAHPVFPVSDSSADLKFWLFFKRFQAFLKPPSLREM